MSQILAGLVGGLLALAGGFSVQLLGARERRQDRARQLVSAFLADCHHVLMQIGSYRLGDGTVGFLDLFPAIDIASRSGYELALLSPPELSQQIKTLLGQLQGLIFVKRENEDEFDGMRTEYFKSYTAVSDDLHTQFGTKPIKRLWHRKNR